MSSAFMDVSSRNLSNPSNNAINEDQQQQQQQQQQYSSQELASDLRHCSISSNDSSSIDIEGQPVSSDILVALLDRPAEMKGLAACNAQFYEALEHYITETQGNHAWQRFQDVVYKPREKLPDRPWMNRISHFLEHNPVFLAKFKESVGYVDDNEQSFVPLPPPSSSSGGGGAGRRRSQRLSNDDDDDDDTVSFEHAPKVTEGMFSSEDQFYHQNVLGSGGFGDRRRRSSYHSMQSEPHPTFVESKIDEVDEANIEVDALNNDGQEGDDHLADLLDSDDNDQQQGDYLRRMKDTGAGSCCTTPTGRDRSSRNYCDMDLIKLREDADFQASLPSTHANYFRKAKQLLSMAPSSSRFAATVRRNSILEGAMPSSPVTELDEPRFQTCSETDENDADGDHLARLICTTRKQQPDDIAWLNSVTEALADWPELIDRLHEIVQEKK